MPLAILLLLFAVIAGSVGMAGMFGWIMHRLSKLESGSPTETRRLAADNEALRDQIQALQSTLTALDERMDFTEKLLEERRPDPALGPGEEPD
jgi:outer membrane murein-binding lipoprotein Lpp